jgi:hypothetical protein
MRSRLSPIVWRKRSQHGALSLRCTEGVLEDGFKSDVELTSPNHTQYVGGKRECHCYDVRALFAHIGSLIHDLANS